MEKLYFSKLPLKKRQKDHPVRLDKVTYDKVKNISKITHIPLTSVLTVMVDFCIKVFGGEIIGKSRLSRNTCVA